MFFITIAHNKKKIFHLDRDQMTYHHAHNLVTVIPCYFVISIHLSLQVVTSKMSAG